MEKIKNTLLFATALLGLLSCNKPEAPDCFQVAGNNAIEVRTISAFRSLELRDDIDYELQQALDWSVTLEGPENLLSDVETSVNNNTLLIENNNTCNWVRSYKKRFRIRIAGPMRYLLVNNYSTGGVKSVGVLAQDTLIWNNRQAAGTIALQVNNAFASFQSHTGVADVQVQGQVTKLELFNQGVGLMDARLALAQEAYVNNSSINDVYVNATNYLFAYTQFSGNIYYKPYSTLFIDKQLEGAGALKTY